LGDTLHIRSSKRKKEARFRDTPQRLQVVVPGGKKQLSFDEVLALINATLDTFSGNIQLTYNQKVTAVKDIEKLINAGKSQQEIEIEMGNKYKLTPTQVRSIINKLYA
jgi:hypothetical protein